MVTPWSGNLDWIKQLQDAEGVVVRQPLERWEAKAWVGREWKHVIVYGEYWSAQGLVARHFDVSTGCIELTRSGSSDW